MTEAVILNDLPNPNGFRQAIVSWVEEVAARRGKDSELHHQKRAVDALNLLASKIRNLGDQDQQLRALFNIHSLRPDARSSGALFAPSEKQRRVLAQVGLNQQNPEIPPPDLLLSELVAVGVADCVIAVQKDQAERAAKQIEQDRRQEREQAAEKVSSIQESKAKLQGKLDEAEAENAELRAEVEHLRDRVGVDEELAEVSAEAP